MSNPVGVYFQNQPASQDPAYYITIEQAREMRNNGEAWSINHGKDVRLKEAYAAPSPIEELFGSGQIGFMRHTALNEGRCGQFTIGYPIPYAFEGHLKMPKASDVNA